MAQISLFTEETPQFKNTPTFDKIKSDLDKLVLMGDAMSKHLSRMLDEIQEGWSEDEKMMIKNPKEYYAKTNNQQIISKPMAKELSDEALTWLQGCTIEGLVVKLPENGYNKSVYQEVNGRLELIGGKWKGGKIAGFVFQHEPTDLLAEVSQGVKRNLKKEFQFFGTPAGLCDQLVKLSEIADGMQCLEPSAGEFAIGEAIYRAFPRTMDGPLDEPCVTVDYYELMPQNRDVVSKKLNNNKNWLSRTSFMGEDFLKASKSILYDRIIANPPFSKNQDIDHIYQMYELLKPKGRIVTIASKHWQHSSQKKESNFGAWLKTVGARIIENAAGDFKESGTSIATCIIIINKN